jgi:polyphosphate kinase
LLVAPESLEKNINSLIEEQIDLGEEGKIVLKLNNLTDPLIIQKLYDAANAGNQINIIVRGICCLIPIKNINVISILGPFLEHSRIYKFGRSDIEKIYIGSADLMQRNLRHRIEVLVPIKSPIIKKKLSSLLEKYIKSDKYSWTLKNDGTWKKLDGNYNIQEKLNK